MFLNRVELNVLLNIEFLIPAHHTAIHLMTTAHQAVQKAHQVMTADLHPVLVGINLMSGISQDLEQFLANGGKIQQFPPSEKESKVIKFRGFNRAEMNQVLEFLRLNGSSRIKDISLFLDMKYTVVKSILAISRQHGHVVSQLTNGKELWELKQ